jgi:hypothetical protein
MTGGRATPVRFPHAAHSVCSTCRNRPGREAREQRRCRLPREAIHARLRVCSRASFVCLPALRTRTGTGALTDEAATSTTIRLSPITNSAIPTASPPRLRAHTVCQRQPSELAFDPRADLPDDNELIRVGGHRRSIAPPRPAITPDDQIHQGDSDDPSERAAPAQRARRLARRLEQFAGAVLITWVKAAAATHRASQRSYLHAE